MLLGREPSKVYLAVVLSLLGLKAHSGVVAAFTMRSYWRLPCIAGVELLLLSECVSARFTPNNVGFVARSAAEEHDATNANTGTVTSASTGSMQRSSGFYFGEERRLSTTAVALRVP